MQILKRAKGKADGEIASFTENPENVKEEADKRVRRAGYLKSKTKIMIDRPTPEYERQYRRIFGHD